MQAWSKHKRWQVSDRATLEEKLPALAGLLKREGLIGDGDR